MKTKTLMTMAVASTFGLSAAAFAGSGHEVVTPFSVSESGETIYQEKQGFGSSDHQIALGSTSDEAGGSLSYSESATESSASLGTGDSFAFADDGSYSDFYVVSWTPVMVETWDVYLIPIESEELASADTSEIGMPTHELALVTDEAGNLEVALAEIPSDESSLEVAAASSPSDESEMTASG